MGKFGNIPTVKKSIKIAVVEVLSQKILEETDENLAKANEKLLKDIEQHAKKRKNGSLSQNRNRLPFVQPGKPVRGPKPPKGGR